MANRKTRNLDKPAAHLKTKQRELLQQVAAGIDPFPFCPRGQVEGLEVRIQGMIDQGFLLYRDRLILSPKGQAALAEGAQDD